MLFWWSNCDASDSKSFLFWLVHGEVWHIHSISTSVNINFSWIDLPQLWGLFLIGVVFSLLFLGGMNISEGHPPLKTILAIEIGVFLMKQLWSFWFQVNSVLVHSCGAYFLLVWFFPYGFLGGEQLWRASPFENNFCNWNRCSFDEAIVTVSYTHLTLPTKRIV